MNEKIPVPVTFNPQKHHFGFLKTEIENWKKMDWELVTEDLKSIGNNLVDLYLGKLCISEICGQCLDYFHKQNIPDRKSFVHWLEKKEYKKIIFSDASEWVIREGDDPERFIHIHPGKHSLHTVRVRASTLKTILALEIHSCILKKNCSENLGAVNYVRTHYLNLSPVKNLHPEKGIFQFWKLFLGNYPEESSP